MFHRIIPALIAASVLSLTTEEIRTAMLVADYFAADPPTERRGAVVVLGGSEGGLAGSRRLAQRLAADGFDALAVSYFGEEGQPDHLNLVPIEPVGQARAWLQARPGEGDERIAVVGVSKGAELALLAASRDPEFAAVVVGVPSDVVWQGIDMSGGPTGASWTAQGRPLAYTPYDLSQGFRGILQLYVDSLPGAPAEAEIPVERIAGPILMISASDDGLWPSAEMANRIERRLGARGFAHAVINLVYEHAGHAVFGPPIPADAPSLDRALSLGGTIDGIRAARLTAGLG
jgi:dienelactone hydrolase